MFLLIFNVYNIHCILDFKRKEKCISYSVIHYITTSLLYHDTSRKFASIFNIVDSISGNMLKFSVFRNSQLFS